MKCFYLNFVDDFNEAKRILESLKKSGVKIEPIIYQTVIQTVDTLKQAIQVYNEIVNNGIDPTVGTYITLIEKQKTYKDARKILDKYVLSNQYYRERLYTKQAHKNDPLQNIFAILYLKAKRDEEIQQVKKELKFVGMSTDINDYDYFTFKSSKRWAYECRKRLLERGNLSSYIHEVNKFLGISNDEQKTLKSKKNNDTINKIKKVINVYDRNATISDNIKYLYSDCCQVCGKRLDIGSKFYSEVHHIHPLYLNGPDVPENMICLCPNHHILFDRGAITINLEDKTIVHINGTVEELKLLNHDIMEKYIDYHNNNIFNKNQILSSTRIKVDNLVVSYGYRVILKNINTKEEVIISIKKDEQRCSMSFSHFKLLNHKEGDLINLNGATYLILYIIKDSN